jgi:hypothetical protein
MENVVPANDDLNEFIEFLYDGLEGYVYVAAKNPNDPDPKTNWVAREFFSYPEDVGRLAAVIKKASANYEIYMAPALFKDQSSAEKENVKATNVVWAEFDGNAPDSWDDTYLSHAQPSLIVQSSGPQNLHCYWKLQEPLYDTKIIDATNRAIAYGLSADSTGWDAGQILRPPLTLNHKREGEPLPVCLVSNANTIYDIDVFGALPAPPQQDITPWELGSLPNPQDVILKYSFTPDMVLLLGKEAGELKNHRSTALMNLAYGCCQMGMTDAEVFVMLRLMDDKWGKFKDRKDRNKRLAQIVSFARNKYPGEATAEDSDEPFTFVMDFMTFLETEVTVEWIIEPMLMTRGAMLMVGPSGVGKTQWSIQALIHLALGKDWLHYKMPEPKKIAFFSLEMDHPSLKVFLEDMAKALTPPEKELLASNFIVIPHGEPWAMNIHEGQQHVIDVIEAVEPDVVFVDSIGSSIKGNISSDDDVLPLLAFHDKIRKKYGVALWNIHHMRKNSQNGGHASTQDDVYGNQFIFNRASSCYGMLRSKGGSLRVKNLKQRLAPQEEDFFIKRIDHLNFEPFHKDVDEMVETVLEYTKPEEDKGPTKPTAGGFDL